MTLIYSYILNFLSEIRIYRIISNDNKNELFDLESTDFYNHNPKFNYDLKK